jgi:predicted Zn-dependent protease
MAQLAPDRILNVTAPDGALLAEAPLHAIRATSRLGSLRRKLVFPDGGCFETADNDGIDQILPTRGRALHRLESSWRIALASALGACAAVALFALYGVPLTAKFLAQETPQAAAHFMTQQTLSALDGKILRPTRLPAARQQHYAALFNSIAASQGSGHEHYTLLLRNAPAIGPNAFALPDGHIVLTDQMADMARTDGELDGVFAHEMSHVNHAHGLQSVYQAALVPAAIVFITGDASQAAHFATILPGILLQAAYSRGFEQQADDDAAALLRRRGENPAQMADLLERLDRKICSRAAGCPPSWLGTHPATSARAARLRRTP